MSEGGEARNHEAEVVEAIARALLSEQFDIIDRMPEPKRSEYKADVLGSVGDALACAGFSSSQGRDTDAPERSTIEALIPFVHAKTGFGIHNCDFGECQIDPCPLLRSLIARDTIRRAEPQSVKDYKAMLAARSPQGEDHEAGIKAALRAFDDAAMGGFDSFRDEEWPEHAMRQAIAAYLGELLDGETK